MDDNLINALIQDIERAIKATKNQVNKDKFKKSFAALKQLEEDEKKQNESDLLTIESLLSEI